MDSARQILLTLGVGPGRILQETFGESKRSTEPRPREARPSETAVFLHSQKVCQASDGSTLLDMAEQNDVKIPYGCRRANVVRVLRGF